MAADIIDRLKLQKDEFDALVKLSDAYNKLPAVVDDSYPEMRHYYESFLKSFLEACKDNGRI